MTMSTSTAYAAENARHRRTPVYKAEFARSGAIFSTHKLGTAKRYMALPFRSADANISPEEFTSSFGSYSFVLDDRNGEVTALITEGDGILGDMVALSGGFKGISESDFATLPPGLVTDCRMTDDLAGYEFTVTDLHVLTNKDVFHTSTSALTQPMSGSTVDQYVHYVRVTAGGVPGDYQYTNFIDDATFAPALDTAFGVGNWSYYQAADFQNNTTVFCDTEGMLDSGTVRIDNEYIAYTTKNVGSLTGITRADLGSTIADHSTGGVVKEVIRLTGHPIDIYQNVLMYTDKRGLSIDSSIINTTVLAALKITIGASYEMDFRLEEPTNAKTWFEREIFKPLALIPLISGTQMSLKQFATPTIASTTLDHSSILRESDDPDAKPRIGFGMKSGRIWNAVIFKYDSGQTADEFAATSEKFVRQDSIDLYGEELLTISSSGYRSSLAGTATLQEAVAELIFDRFAYDMPRVTLALPLSKHLVEPGDTPGVTTPWLPEKASGERGVTGALMEIINRSINFAEGSVAIELDWVTWNAA
jgi:hypothetical protein